MMLYVRELNMNDYYDNDSGWQVGEKVLAFDHIAWTKNGGDAEDNDIFMRPATIIRIECEDLSDRPEWYQMRYRPRVLARIQWDETGKESHGHFLYALRRRDE